MKKILQRSFLNGQGYLYPGCLKVRSRNCFRWMSVLSRESLDRMRQSKQYQTQSEEHVQAFRTLTDLLALLFFWDLLVLERLSLRERLQSFYLTMKRQG